MSEIKNNFFGMKNGNEGEVKNNFSFAKEEKPQEQEKKKSKKELLKDVKTEKKELVESLKAKDEKVNLNLNIRYIELSLEELDLSKDIYLTTYRNRKKNLKSKYYKAYAESNGGKLD